ncbi:MAG: hypothetical protein K8H87_01095, partial [Pseudorhodoplanes sp.]|nr:hypothetical protein [Pseudorhodoplanes sp.]
SYEYNPSSEILSSRVSTSRERGPKSGDRQEDRGTGRFPKSDPETEPTKSIPPRQALRVPKRDGRDKPGHDGSP